MKRGDAPRCDALVRALVSELEMVCMYWILETFFLV